MTTYKDIHGTAVQNVAGNPDNPQKGQLWYDSTNSEFKFQDQVVGDAWSTQADMNTAREGLSGSGTQTAALGWAGATQPGSIRAETEFWNGSTWTELNDLNQSKTLDAGAGTVYTSSLSFGGRNPGGTRIALTELFNGTNWTEVNDLNTARGQLSGTGSGTSALAFAGENPGAAVRDETESWNGTNWTEVADLAVARMRPGAAGASNTAALQMGGADNSGPNPAKC